VAQLAGLPGGFRSAAVPLLAALALRFENAAMSPRVPSRHSSVLSVMECLVHNRRVRLLLFVFVLAMTTLFGQNGD